MKSWFLAAVLLSTPPLRAQEPSPPQAQPESQPKPPTAKELVALLKNAKTRDEFKAIALFYHVEAASFEALARTSKKEWDAERSHPTGSSKFPTGSDRARHLSQYYASRAERASRYEEKYEARAKSLEARPKP